MRPERPGMISWIVVLRFACHHLVLDAALRVEHDREDAREPPLVQVAIIPCGLLLARERLLQARRADDAQHVFLAEAGNDAIEMPRVEDLFDALELPGAREPRHEGVVPGGAAR